MEIDVYYMLIDLERTIHNKTPFYWLGNKHGYTPNIREAGLFPKHLAEEIVKQDRDHKTVMLMVPKTIATEIQRKDRK